MGLLYMYVRARAWLCVCVYVWGLSLFNGRLTIKKGSGCMHTQGCPLTALRVCFCSRLSSEINPTMSSSFMIGQSGNMKCIEDNLTEVFSASETQPVTGEAFFSVPA